MVPRLGRTQAATASAIKITIVAITGPTPKEATA
jgi:hypothetical protein